MAYEALARKWRPKTFGEIVGQGHVTRSLANAISSGKIHHAYLFSGTRGVGKTTFARILARALNCADGPTAAPCLACPACTEILAGAAVDVQEIDGASNTGIDDVRRLRENAAYAPARLRYKVYIIDEVHMLSKAAFNGLLKILEEPPAHVVFVFATTEPNRIPDTILSRVQRFDFRMLTEEEIASRLREICAAEGIRFAEDGLHLLARCAFGSMRDGQSLLEQAAVSGEGAITAALVEEMVGLVGTEAAIDLVSAVASGEAAEALSRLTALLTRGADFKYLYLAVIDVLRDAAVLSWTGQEALLYRHAPASLDRIKALCAAKSREEWMFLLDIAFRSERDVLATEFPRLGFELLILRLVNAPGLLDVETLAEGGFAPLPDAASRPQAAPAARVAAGSPADIPAKTGRAQTTFARKAADREAPRSAGGDLFEGLRKNLEARGKTLILALLAQMRGGLEGDDLVITCPHEMVLERLREEDKWPILLEAAEEAAGRKITVRLAASAEKKSPKSAEPPGDERAGLERRALSDPLVIEVLREFDGATVLEVRLPPKDAPPPPPVAEGMENGDVEEEG